MDKLLTGQIGQVIAFLVGLFLLVFFLGFITDSLRDIQNILRHNRNGD